MVRYKMLARDVDSIPTQYRTWVVEDEPDFTGQFYTGLKSGPNPFIDVSAYTIYDNSAVVNFNLPNAMDWSTTKRVLPAAIYDSQLAVVDGYVYLFGGLMSDKIFRATLDRPAEWEDTGATLPTVLGGSQLAIIDGYIYLFGGNNSGATDTIYSAPTSDPLTWTNQGSLLPQKVTSSQLAIIDGYIYLFGGYGTSNNAISNILQASAAAPLSWIDTGNSLPDPLYASQVAIIDGYTYLFGGLSTDGYPMDHIYSAHIETPTVWNWVEILPYPTFYGQFVIVGNQGFLITPGVTIHEQDFKTRILRCNLSSPVTWVDTKRVIPGIVTQSQLAIIYDRLFLFGGNGSSVIFANNSLLKYVLGSPTVVSYGNTTRTEYDAAPTPLDLFEILGFPYWKTDYGS